MDPVSGSSSTERHESSSSGLMDSVAGSSSTIRHEASSSGLVDPIAGSSSIGRHEASSSELIDPVSGSSFSVSHGASSSHSGLTYPVAGSGSTQHYETDPRSLSLRTTSNVKVQYQVQHGHLKWSIENFSAFPDVNDKYCLSPVFDLKGIWWYISLHPKVKISGMNKISLNLIRHKSDHGPNIVSVSYRLGLENDKNKIWFKLEESIVFAKGDCYGFQTSIFGHLEDFLHVGIANNNDTLSVLCEMYVSYTQIVNNPSSTPKKRTTVDTELPSNLVSMYNKGELSDILILVDTRNAHVKAHKAVLCARSKTLARLLEDNKSFIRLSCTRSCLLCVLLYIYSGNFNFMVKNAVFSIGLYELACELALDKLRDLLTPHRVELKSKIQTDEFNIKCTFHDFDISDIFKANRETRVYFDRATGIGIKISLRKIISHENVEFRVKISGIVTALDFSFAMYILDKDEQPEEMIPATFPQDSSATFTDLICTASVYFSVTDVIRCGLSDGNLYVLFVCRRHSLIHLQDMHMHARLTEIRQSCDDTDTWLEDLSTDFKKLFKSGYLSDVTLVTASEQSFKLHRSIMAARSTYCHDRFLYDGYKNEVIRMDKTLIELRTLELLFTYMYSGSLVDRTDVSRVDILELYKATEMFKMNSLKRKCEKYLSMCFDPKFVFHVLSSAEHYSNSQLTKVCKDYISQLFRAQEVSSPDSLDSEEES